jgi:histidine ammonia-lyase
MGTNSAVITKKVIENGFQVMAIHMMALCQAIDLLEDNKRQKLSAQTMKVYDIIRTIAPVINEDVAQFENIKNVTDTLRNTTLDI